MFIDKHKQFDIIKNCINFLKTMEELELYIIGFNQDSIIKPKVNPLNCIVDREERWPIIVITSNEYNFSVNNDIKKLQTCENEIFL